MRSVLLRLAGAVTCAIAVVAMSVVPTYAGPDLTPAPNPGGGDDGTGTHGTVGGCHVVAGPNYMGITCPGGIANGQDFSEWIKHNLPVPDCWHDRPLTEAELEAVGEQNKPDPNGTTWYWKRCLKGIDAQGNITGPIVIETQLVEVANGSELQTIPHKWEIRLPNLTRPPRSVPFPVMITSPTTNAVVYRDLAFFSPTEDEVELEMQHGGGWVKIRAVAHRLTVHPLGKDRGPVVECAGDGVPVGVNDTREGKPEACWYRYEKSSAGQQDSVYRAWGSVHWRVYVSSDNEPERLFTEFDKSGFTRVPVREVQAIAIF